MKKALLLPFCFALSLLAGDQPVSVTKESAFTFYKDFKRLTKQPHYVAPLTAVMCASPSPELIERERKATGLHYKTSVHIYANSLASETVTRKLKTFPPGAVIVKEKLANDGSVSGVGGMIKREAGFDTKNGDWEYFYSDQTAGFSTGRMQNCIDCHSGTKQTDYIFGTWKQSEQSRL